MASTEAVVVKWKSSFTIGEMENWCSHYVNQCGEMLLFGISPKVSHNYAQSQQMVVQPLLVLLYLQ